MTNVVVGRESSTVLSPSTSDRSDGSGRLLDAALLGVLVVSTLIFYRASTHGTWNPLYQDIRILKPAGTGQRFFLAQARAITHGRLWVQKADLNGDCFVHLGRCYGYFGLTPSVLRLPFLPLLDYYNNGFTPIFVTAGLTLATGSFLASLRHLFVRMPLGRTTTVFVALTGMSFGAASVLTQLAPPDVYDEAIVWAVGFLSLAVFCFIRWWEGPQLKWYLLLLGSLVMAANARPTALPFALIIGLGVGYRLWRLGRVGPAHWVKTVALGGVMIVLPIATCIGVFLLKFGQPIPSYLLDREVGGPFATAQWLRIRTIDHDQLTSVRFIPTALFAYLRPDALAFSRAFPWVGFRFLGAPPITYIGLPRGSLYTGTVTSLTATMPLSFVAAIGAAAYQMGRRGNAGVRQLLRSHTVGSQAFWKAIVLVAAVASWGVVLTGVAVQDRFLGDAYPLMALVLLLSLPSLARALDRQGRLLKIGAILIVLAGVSWQLLVNIALTWRYPGG